MLTEEPPLHPKNLKVSDQLMYFPGTSFFFTFPLKKSTFFNFRYFVFLNMSVFQQNQLCGAPGRIRMVFFMKNEYEGSQQALCTLYSVENEHSV